VCVCVCVHVCVYARLHALLTPFPQLQPHKLFESFGARQLVDGDGDWYKGLGVWLSGVWGLLQVWCFVHLTTDSTSRDTSIRYLDRCRLVFSGRIPSCIESSIPLFSGLAPSPLTPCIYRMLVTLSNRNVGVRGGGWGWAARVFTTDIPFHIHHRCSLSYSPPMFPLIHR